MPTPTKKNRPSVKNTSSILFCDGDGNPLKFFISGLPLKQSIENYIRQGGGSISAKPSTTTIYIGEKRNYSYGGSQYNVQWLWDSIDDGNLLSREDYRFVVEECTSASSIDGDSGDNNDNKVSSYRRPAGIPYSKEEDLLILRYILDNNKTTEVNGKSLWEQMSKTKKLKHRTWQSMRERFRRHIQLKITCYGLKKSEVQLINSGFNRSSKPKRRSSLSSRTSPSKASTSSYRPSTTTLNKDMSSPLKSSTSANHPPPPLRASPSKSNNSNDHLSPTSVSSRQSKSPSLSPPRPSTSKATNLNSRPPRSPRKKSCDLNGDSSCYGSKENNSNEDDTDESCTDMAMTVTRSRLAKHQEKTANFKPLLNGKPWKRRQRILVPYPDSSDSSDDDNMEKFLAAQKSKIKIRSESEDEDSAAKRLPDPNSASAKQFSVQEDMDILEYLWHKKCYDRVGGNTIWKRMQRTNVSSRSWHSLKNRLKKSIYPNLRRYKVLGVPDAVLSEMKNCFDAAMSKSYIKNGRNLSGFIEGGVGLVQWKGGVAPAAHADTVAQNTNSVIKQKLMDSVSLCIKKNAARNGSPPKSPNRDGSRLPDDSTSGVRRSPRKTVGALGSPLRSSPSPRVAIIKLNLESEEQKKKGDGSTPQSGSPQKNKGLVRNGQLKNNADESKNDGEVSMHSDGEANDLDSPAEKSPSVSSEITPPATEVRKSPRRPIPRPVDDKKKRKLLPKTIPFLLRSNKKAKSDEDQSQIEKCLKPMTVVPAGVSGKYNSPYQLK